MWAGEEHKLQFDSTSIMSGLIVDATTLILYLWYLRLMLLSSCSAI
jgi:hypothetical protein